MVDMGKVDKKGMDMENRDKLVKVPLPNNAEGVKELRETMLESGKSVPNNEGDSGSIEVLLGRIVVHNAEGTFSWIRRSGPI